MAANFPFSCICKTKRAFSSVRQSIKSFSSLRNEKLTLDFNTVARNRCHRLSRSSISKKFLTSSCHNRYFVCYKYPHGKDVHFKPHNSPNGWLHSLLQQRRICRSYTFPTRNFSTTFSPHSIEANKEIKNHVSQSNISFRDKLNFVPKKGK